MTGSEASLGNIVMLGFFYYLLTGVKAHHSRVQLILPLTKDAALLNGGSGTLDLFVVHLPSKVLWCSTVLKQWRLLMFEGNFLQMFSGHKQNISNHCCFGMVLAKNPWHSSVVYVDAGAFDMRLRVTSKFLLLQLLHMKWDVSAYQSTGQCLYLSVLNFISQHHFLICVYSSVHIKKTKKL